MIVLLFKKIKRKIYPVLNLPTDNEGDMGKNKTQPNIWGGGDKMGANISMYTVCFKSD